MKKFLCVLCLFSFTFVCAQQVHVIRRGETLELIAKRYGITLDELKKANPSDEGCFVGMELQIPSRQRNQTSGSDRQEVASSENAKYAYASSNTFLMLEKASAYVKKKKYRKAASIYSDVIKVSPSAVAYYGRGCCFYYREKYKSAIKNFEKASTMSGCPDEMKNQCNQLIASAQTLREEKHKRRNAFWGDLALVLVESAAVAVATTMAVTPSSTSYAPSVNATGFRRDTSMDYLLDPRYTLMKMNQRDMMEYQQFKQFTGQDISFEDFRLLKYSSMSSDGGATSVDTNTGGSYESSVKSQSSSRSSCPYCKNGKIEINKDIATYGQTPYKKRCNECGFSYMSSTAHYHVSCGHCGGRGYKEYK